MNQTAKFKAKNHNWKKRALMALTGVNRPAPLASIGERDMKWPFPAERQRRQDALNRQATAMLAAVATIKPKRGGKREGAGRKPLAPDETSVVYALRVTQAQRAKIDALGGQAALRKLIDKAKVKP